MPVVELMMMRLPLIFMKPSLRSTSLIGLLAMLSFWCGRESMMVFGALIWLG